jgi:hypothetical protein
MPLRLAPSDQRFASDSGAVSGNAIVDDRRRRNVHALAARSVRLMGCHVEQFSPRLVDYNFQLFVLPPSRFASKAAAAGACASAVDGGGRYPSTRLQITPIVA